MGVVWQVSPIGLETEFYKDVHELLNNSPYRWYITCGFRDRKTSDVLYQKFLHGGPKAAPGGKSAHNIGEAVDVVEDGSDKPGLQMDWETSDAAWTWLFDAIKRHPRLHSGVSFADEPHIESVKFSRNRLSKPDGSYYVPGQHEYVQVNPTVSA